jgi:parvulin-like peptidyl-prolyl isomerase
MFANIRKHQKWLMALFSSAVIISFVWYFNPASRYSSKYGTRGGSDNVVGEVFGQPITHSHYVELQKEAILAHLFQYGEWPRNDETSRQLKLVERETKQRSILTHKLKDYNIEVSDDAVADWIANTLRDPETKSFQKEFYDRFLKNLPSHGLKETDFERFARHQVGIQHLAALVSIPGKLVTPQEAASEYREENEKADTKIVFFNSSNYLARVEVKPEELAKFYTNRSAAYRLPERVQLSYVAFPFSNYTAQAEQKLAKETNITENIDAIYNQRGPAYYTDPTGQVMAPEAAKAKIREELSEEFAKRDAREAAIAFAEKLTTNNAPAMERLQKVAQESGLQVQETEPFGQYESPKGMNVPDKFAKAAFALNPVEPIFEEPIVGEDTVYVVSYKSRVPSQLPSLESIHDKVVEDYRRFEAQKMAREAGTAFAAAATNGIAAGKTFDQIAQEAGYTPNDLQPFAHNARFISGLEGRGDPMSVRNSAFALKPGQASGFQTSPDGGYVVYLEKIVPASDEDVKKDLPNFVEELRRRRASNAFEEWFDKELAAANPRLPGDREEAQTATQ